MSRTAKATLMLSVLLYGALLYSIFAEAAFWVRSFGPSAFGMPMPVAVAAGVTLLCLPAPWFLWHVMRIVLKGQELGLPLGHFGLFYTLSVIGKRVPELRRSQWIVLGGFCYFIALIAAWIWYADARGI